MTGGDDQDQVLDDGDQVAGELELWLRCETLGEDVARFVGEQLAPLVVPVLDQGGDLHERLLHPAAVILRQLADKLDQTTLDDLDGV